MDHYSCWCYVPCWSKFASSAIFSGIKHSSAAVNEKPIWGPGTDTVLDPRFSQTLYFCATGNLWPAKRVFSLSVHRGRKAEACTFLTQLAGPYFVDAPLSPLAPCPPSLPLWLSPSLLSGCVHRSLLFKGRPCVLHHDRWCQQLRRLTARPFNLRSCGGWCVGWQVCVHDNASECRQACVCSACVKHYKKICILQPN